MSIPTAQVDLASQGLVDRMASATITASSPAAARQFVRRQLEAVGAPDVTESAELAVSELVTNAMAHGHAQHPLLVVTIERDRVHIEVSDDGPLLELHPKSPDPTRTGGFGLFIVESIASRWGTRERDAGPDGPPGGKVVWFELDLP